KKNPLFLYRTTLPVYHKNRGISIDFQLFYKNYNISEWCLNFFTDKASYCLILQAALHYGMPF
ncbi:hypothetical protein RFZ03_10615, partial [Acinetobacter baumannii]|nr:hypothetical protein [Acinetobacter baumannii]